MIGQPWAGRLLFFCPDGKDSSGYLPEPGRANAPGVVVIQEWWGLQNQIKGICDRFALAGYEALAPDLYSGTVVPYHDTEAADREMSSLNFLDATDQVVRGAVAFLKLTGVKVGLTGFCMGGAVTIFGAIRIPELTAAVCFYGLPPDSPTPPTSACRCRRISPTTTTGARPRRSTTSKRRSTARENRPRYSATRRSTAS